MLLVADSGSTKADWLLFDGEKITGPIHQGIQSIFSFKRICDGVLDEVGGDEEYS
ncbi:MAG: hypothetical protein IPO63_09275 [Bacteroidetes bacterium]|nr:hypothetical protein [Bacteroidota bacterium]